MENKANKPHHAGRDRAKKTSGGNEKAFAPSSGIRSMRNSVRNADNNEKKLHAPLVNRSINSTPYVVVVAGPPKSGKTTLIKALVKRYSKHSPTEIHGPITVVSGKGQRLTFIECCSDINAMVDLAKIADLVVIYL